MAYLFDISGLNMKDKSVKDLIVNVLVTEWPITLKRIYNLLKKRYSLSASYQAVHKALNELIEKNVVIKNNREYSLNMAWIKDIKDFSKKLEDSYADKNPMAGAKWKEDATMQTFVFDNLFNMDKFLLSQVSKLLSDEKLSKVPLYSHWQFAWWPLFFSRAEYQVFGKIINPERAYISIKNNSNIAKWCSNFYSKGKFKIKIGVEIENNFDFLIFGDTVIQMYWPESIKKDLSSAFNNVKSIEQLDMDKIIKIFERPEKIDVVVLRNENIAKHISENYLKEFE